MVDLTNYLDLQDVIINEIFGDWWLFAIIGFILVAYFSARFNMDWRVSITLEVLFLAVIVSAFEGAQIIYVLLLLIVPALFYYTVREKIKST